MLPGYEQERLSQIANGKCFATFAGFYLQIFNFLLSICILNGRRTPSAKFGTIQRAGKIFFLFVKVKTAVKIQENIAKADKSEIQRT